MSKRSAYQYGTDKSGQKHWRSLGEYASSAQFDEALKREFPDGASELTDDVGRRSFIGLMGASLGLAGLAACRRPEQKILPYNKRPEDVIEGASRFFATAMPFGSTAIGLLVESHEGRPTKVEGNPGHPESLGGTNIYAQASVLDLYDPDRAQSPSEKGVAKSWSDAEAALAAAGKRADGKQGAGLVILTEAHRSPTLGAQLAQLKARWPQAKVVRYEPLSNAAHRDGVKLAFGTAGEAVLDLAKAKVVVSLDHDFLQTEGGTVRHARGFAESRRLEGEEGDPSRLYVVEANHSVTGANADHRLRLASREVPAFAFALAKELAGLGVDLGAGVAGALPAAGGLSNEKSSKWVKAVAADLVAKKGTGLVTAGQRQPAVVHALCAAINAGLGSIGTTVSYVAPFDDADDSAAALVDLATQLKAGQVETLVVLGGNPAYNAPGDLDFAGAMAKAGASFHLSEALDETATASGWHLNRAHYLEQWSDVSAADGTTSIVQPLVAPLYGARTDAEVVSALVGEPKSAYRLVRDYWASQQTGLIDAPWRQWLHSGVVEGRTAAKVGPALTAEGLVGALASWKPAAKDGLEVVFYADAHHWDGRYANNGWLNEMPDPMTKVTWDNAALVSPKTAKALGVGLSALEGETRLQFDHLDTEVVEVTVGGAKVALPVLIIPGHADDSISVTLGWGRTRSGKVGTGTGVDVAPLRSVAGFWGASATAAKTAATVKLARTQEHNSMEGRPLAREATLVNFKKNPEFAREMVELPKQKQLNLFSNEDAMKYDGHRWGMVIDLHGCIGCNACMVACQSENNIPLVGKEGVLRGREMHWIRVDRYFSGDPDEAEVIHQPIGCQQCENAPCELVCPVAATTHSPEGLNDMAYNRCVGTRYCANNCPYKVRRFNYFNYNRDIPELRKMQFNPNVTVRARGVMEKCTYCVQRVQEGKIAAKRDQRDRVKDGEVNSACAQACPTGAITFGDLADKNSKVAKKAADERGYKLLEELNTRPRTSFLARIRNPNPALETA
jgi:MoCo/4Fe-4S cofactor protein with predicted Tat translocation signal